MRVVVANKYYYLLGGVERYVEQLTRLLQRRGHHVIPFAMADPRNEPTEYADAFVSPIGLSPEHGSRPAPWVVAERVIYSREARRKMADLLQATDPNLAHVHNIYHHISPSILDALRESRIPVVMTLHDYKLICPAYMMWTDGATCERCQGARFYQCAVHRCNHRSLSASVLNVVEAYAHRMIRVYDSVDLFIAPSRFLRAKHITNGVSAERIVHIPNFVDLTQYVPCFEHDQYFAYVGRLMPFKGLSTLLQAVSLVDDPPQLLIVGDGPLRGELEARARNLGLDTVCFLGFQSGETLRNLISRAMFVVVPSEWYENCPYAILEALALGTPVVASAIGGIPEMVEDGVSGVLVPPHDVDSLAEALTSLIGTPERLPVMAQAARKKAASEYGEQHHATLLSRAYASVGAGEL